MPVSAFPSRPAVSPAERIWLSPEATEDRTALPAQLRQSVNMVIRAIKNNPDWNAPSRALAPANSHHPGCIVDVGLAYLGLVVAYRLRDHGADVEIVRIERIAIG
jgi:hypothetical protein